MYVYVYVYGILQYGNDKKSLSSLRFASGTNNIKIELFNKDNILGMLVSL